MQIVDDSQTGVSVNDPSTDEMEYKGIYAQRTDYLCERNVQSLAIPMPWM